MKSIVFTVCKHELIYEYVPLPIIDLPLSRFRCMVKKYSIENYRNTLGSLEETRNCVGTRVFSRCFFAVAQSIYIYIARPGLIFSRNFLILCE